MSLCLIAAKIPDMPSSQSHHHASCSEENFSGATDFNRPSKRTLPQSLIISNQDSWYLLKLGLCLYSSRQRPVFTISLFSPVHLGPSSALPRMECRGSCRHLIWGDFSRFPCDFPTGNRRFRYLDWSSNGEWF